MTHTLFNDILTMLSDDMVSRGLIAQCLEDAGEDLLSPSEKEGKMLRELLASETVEIGVPSQLRPDYLEFVAWRGSVEDRVRRAMQEVANTVGHDKEFSYWLCLRKNVDRYESEE
jgi:hypothetical protein